MVWSVPFGWMSTSTDDGSPREDHNIFCTRERCLDEQIEILKFRLTDDERDDDIRIHLSVAVRTCSRETLLFFPFHSLNRSSDRHRRYKCCLFLCFSEFQLPKKTFSLFLGALSSIGRGPRACFFPQIHGGWSRSWPFELRSLLVNRPVFKLLYILYDISWSACRFVARRHRLPHLSSSFFFNFKLRRSDLLLIWKLLSYGWSLLLLLWTQKAILWFTENMIFNWTSAGSQLENYAQWLRSP